MNSDTLARFYHSLESLELPQPNTFLIIDLHVQQLFLYVNKQIHYSQQISSSRFGIGSGAGTFKTPLGMHHLYSKIGANAPAGRIFKSRQDTGRNWNGSLEDENMILSRILQLEGLEPTINKGPGVDTLERYIYIHGTNQEALIGTPISHGCICMRNNDIIELFDLVEEGLLVYITE